MRLVKRLSAKLRNKNSDLATEFYSYINHLLENDQVKQLDTYIQHYCFSRLQHSLDVAYFSFMIAKFFRWDARSVARAGLLHDLFLYDRYSEEYDGEKHLRSHPQIAYENAKAVCDLNKVEKDIILKHMWLVTLMPPRYKESYIVTFVDKYCALREFFISLSRANRANVRMVYVNQA